MSLLRTYIREVEVNEPKNLKDLIIKINHDSSSQDETVGSLQFDFFNQSAKLLNVARKSSVGVFEGVPFRLELDSQTGFKKDIVNGFIDLWAAEYANNSITATVTQIGGIDDFNDKIDSISNYNLFDKGILQYIDIPYCISKHDNIIDELLALTSTYFIAERIYNEIDKLSELTIEAANPFEATSLVRASLRLIYISTLVLSLKTYSEQIFEGLIQPIHYKKSINVYDYLVAGCKYLGFEFQSSIVHRNAYVVVNSSLDGLFGDFFRAIAVNYNARVIVRNGFINFQKQDFRLGGSSFQLPNLLDSKDEFRYNKEDFATTIEVKYEYDLQDNNTIYEWIGTNYQVNQLPNAISDTKLQIGKGLKVFNIPFALGKRKESLSTVEEIFSTFFELINDIVQILIDAINLVIDALNFIIDILNDLLDLPIVGDLFEFDIPNIPNVEIESFGNLIENRIGLLKLESKEFGVNKLVTFDENFKIINTFSAKYAYENYYYFESFAKNGDWIGNQYLLRKFDKIKFSVKDFEKVIDNKFMLDGQGNEAEILTLDYNPIEETATGTYRTHQRYLDNIKIETIEPSGR